MQGQLSTEYESVVNFNLVFDQRGKTNYSKVIIPIPVVNWKSTPSYYKTTSKDLNIFLAITFYENNARFPLKMKRT